MSVHVIVARGSRWVDVGWRVNCPYKYKRKEHKDEQRDNRADTARDDPGNAESAVWHVLFKRYGSKNNSRDAQEEAKACQ